MLKANKANRGPKVVDDAVSVSPHACGVPSGAPEWVTPKLIEQTVRVWQPYYADPLTADDALEMITGAVRLIDALSGG